MLEGREELLRLRSLELEPVTTYPNPEIEVNRPVVPQKIQRVEVELFGQEYPEPVRLEEAELPECWRQVWE